MFISVLSEAEQSKVFGEAFSKARSDAEREAKLAGIELGSLKLMSTGIYGESDDNLMYSGAAARNKGCHPR